MKLKQARFVAVIAVLAFRLAACGGNPAGPSNEGVTLEGTVVGSTFGTASVRSTSAAVLTVVVADHPEMTTTIVNGRFTLRGLPEGTFTLIFRSDRTEIGRLPFGDVTPNQSITVTVAISATSVSLVSEQRNGGGQAGPQAPQPGATPGATCMINGGRVLDGIELEGRVASGAYPAFTMTVNGNRASGPVTVDATLATVQCSPANGPNAPTVAQCQARVSGTQRIHVRGTLSACTLTTATVAANRVIVQGN